MHGKTTRFEHTKHPDLILVHSLAGVPPWCALWCTPFGVTLWCITLVPWCAGLVYPLSVLSPGVPFWCTSASVPPWSIPLVYPLPWCTPLVHPCPLVYAPGAFPWCCPLA